MPATTTGLMRTAVLLVGALAARAAPGVDIQYLYDSNGQLREITRDDGWHISLEYDAAGNLIARDVEPTTSADVSVELSDHPDPVDEGASLSYVSTVTNLGPNAATVVTFSMSVPHLTPVRALVATQGTCTTDPIASCELGTLAAGASATVTADVVAAGLAMLEVTARATSRIFDPDTGNNVVTESTSVSSESGPQLQLTLGQLDTGQYGYQYGAGEHRRELVILFDGGAEDLLFSLVGHDVDYDVELSVFLNDTALGFLGRGENDGDNRGDTFRLPASAMSPGSNRLRIHQLVSGSTWGVSNLLLSRASNTTGPTLPLSVGEVYEGAYGWNFGSSLHLTEVVATFEKTDGPLYLSVLGYDVEFPAEVTVWLNGTALGSLIRGEDASLNDWSTIEIPAERQVSGTNVMRFRKGFGDSTWGIAYPILWEPSQ